LFFDPHIFIYIGSIVSNQLIRYHGCMKKLILLFLLFSSLTFAGELRLKERLEKAKCGDYVVTEANKMITLLVLRSISPQSFIIEEITAPSHALKKQPASPASWSEWIKNKAPGHTSWSMIEIDRTNGQISECYSFSRSAWIRLSNQESLFASLMNLPMKEIPQENRRKIGPPPMNGEKDHRQVWSPPLLREGKKIEKASFAVYETVWPDDGSEIAGRIVSLYFDTDKQFPFPFWIQAETTHVTATLQTIDSGKNLPTIHKELPRRIPEFVGHPLKTATGITLSLKSPKYYREFELFAVDVTTREKQMLPITHSLIQGEEESITIQIDREELEKNLKNQHRYTWLLVPVDHTESYTETHQPFTF
jgi:hypothetical protein